MNARNLNPMLLEHRAWRLLCEALEETGAVTRADLESPATMQETKGQQLLETIRQWGETLVDLRRTPDA